MLKKISSLSNIFSSYIHILYFDLQSDVNSPNKLFSEYVGTLNIFGGKGIDLEKLQKNIDKKKKVIDEKKDIKIIEEENPFGIITKQTFAQFLHIILIDMKTHICNIYPLCYAPFFDQFSLFFFIFITIF